MKLKIGGKLIEVCAKCGGLKGQHSYYCPLSKFAPARFKRREAEMELKHKKMETEYREKTSSPKGKKTTKKEKAKDINNAIKRSAEAKEVDAKAEILKDDTIQYSIKTKTRTGRAYRIKVSFSKILSYLWGEDMRKLKRRYGR